MTRRQAAQRSDITDALAFLAVRLSGLRCAGCGSSDVVSVSPGSEPDGFADLFITARPEPVRAFCERCAVAHGWLAPHIGPVAA